MASKVRDKVRVGVRKEIYGKLGYWGMKYCEDTLLGNKLLPFFLSVHPDALADAPFPVVRRGKERREQRTGNLLVNRVPDISLLQRFNDSRDVQSVDDYRAGVFGRAGVECNRR